MVGWSVLPSHDSPMERWLLTVDHQALGLVYESLLSHPNNQGKPPGCCPTDDHVCDHRLQLPAPWNHHSNICVCLQPRLSAARSKPPSSHPSSVARPPRAQTETLQCCPRTYLHCGQALHTTGGGRDPTQPRREGQRYVVYCCFYFHRLYPRT